MFEIFKFNKHKKQINELIDINQAIGRAYEDMKLSYERKIEDLQIEVDEVQEVCDKFGEEIKLLKKKLEDKAVIPEELKLKIENKANAFENLMSYNMKKAVMGK